MSEPRLFEIGDGIVTPHFDGNFTLIDTGGAIQEYAVLTGLGHEMPPVSRTHPISEGNMFTLSRRYEGKSSFNSVGYQVVATQNKLFVLSAGSWMDTTPYVVIDREDLNNEKSIFDLFLYPNCFFVLWSDGSVEQIEFKDNEVVWKGNIYGEDNANKQLILAEMSFVGKKIVFWYRDIDTGETISSLNLLQYKSDPIEHTPQLYGHKNTLDHVLRIEKAHDLFRGDGEVEPKQILWSKWGESILLSYLKPSRKNVESSMFAGVFNTRKEDAEHFGKLILTTQILGRCDVLSETVFSVPCKDGIWLLDGDRPVFLKNQVDNDNLQVVSSLVVIDHPSKGSVINIHTSKVCRRIIVVYQDKIGWVDLSNTGDLIDAEHSDLKSLDLSSHSIKAFHVSANGAAISFQKRQS